MKTLTLVFSPFQMFNAIEARHSLQVAGDECHLVYCRGVSAKNAEQIRNMIRPEDWAGVHYIADLEKAGTLRSRRQQLEKIWTEIGDVSRLVLGHFGFSLGRHLVNRYQPAEVVVLDDGTASHRIFEYRFHDQVPGGGNEKVRPWMRPLRRAIQRVVLGVDARAPKQLTFFSIYRHRMHACDRMLPNTYSHWKKQVPERVQTNEVHFLGGCLVELGIVSAEYYEDCLKKVCLVHEGRRIKYFPHRRESPERLEKLNGRYGFEIVKPDLPYEVFIAQGDVLPEWLATFYSTAVDSCSILLEGRATGIQAFELKQDEIQGNEQRKFVGLVYDYYRRAGAKNVAVIPLK